MNHYFCHRYETDFTQANRSRAGSALVITLVLVLLLTVLVVAFFSHVIASRKGGDSSANTTKVSLFAHGAVETILGDLNQEIIDGSTVSTPATGQNVYIPKTPQNMVPERTGTSATYPNLVKSSQYNVKFYSNGVARAANSSSLTASLTGRKMTPARWNKPLFLPRANTASATDFTPSGASSANNTWSNAPNWVLVARDGSNPTTWAPALADGSPANNSFAIGRYAYAIYDEGGLIDANAAGYPSGTPVTNELTNAPPLKPNMAFADLKQLPGISDLANVTLESKVIDQLLTVRNYTSSSTGSSTFAENYYRFALPAPNGFLTVGNNALGSSGSPTSTRSDMLFSSRQDLIQFVLQSLPQLSSSSTGSFTAAQQTQLTQTLPTALQYLTHFSRALDQPSVSPPAGRPTIVSGTGGNTSVGNDNAINPNFLNVRVTTAGWNRNDGITKAVAGEPLVKTRFALNRLAWITYKGPICTDDAGTFSTDQAVKNIIAEYERRGLTQAFLQRGGPTNIQNYFGLKWDSSIGAWRYNVHNGASGIGNIMRLGAIAALNREPDFVELLKATINVGSLAKGAYTDTNTMNAAVPPVWQYNHDNNTDFAIMQIFANIIDQFDLDGFPTRIRFNIGGSFPEQEIHGVENLPYFYRTRISAALAVLPVPMQPYYANQPIQNTGAWVVMATPEIWNPHDQSSTRCALDNNGVALTDGASSGVGNPLYPTSFRIIANSIDPDHLDLGLELPMHIEAADPGSDRSYFTTDPALTPVQAPTTPNYPYLPAFTGTSGGADYSNHTVIWNAATTEMTFTVPSTVAGTEIFREPTVLSQLGVPAGSLLKVGVNNYLRNVSQAGNRLSGLSATSNGIVLHVPNGEGYFGMYLGTVPQQWWGVYTGTLMPPGTEALHTLATFIGGASETLYATFRVQCADPVLTGTWETYDQKYVQQMFDENLTGHPDGSEAVSGSLVGDHLAYLGDDSISCAWDPRTARFASPFQPTYALPPSYYNPVTEAERYGALDARGNVIVSGRPDLSSGFGSGQATGWYQGLPNADGWVPQSPNGTQMWHMGMISQNNSAFSGTGLRWSGDTNTLSSGVQYYSDPDGVVRRAMAGYVTTGTTGLPMATATTFTGTTKGIGAAASAPSRPMILNRPFASVAELGYVFSGTPWKNLNFFTPESGDDGLLDVFCISETTPSALVAGKVNLNTLQYPVLQAIMSGAYKDTLAITSTTSLSTGTSGEAANLSAKLVARTTGTTTNGQTPPASGAQPLINIGDLVGRWTSGTTYDGFSADVSADLPNVSDQMIQRMREAPIRALASSGQTRVWNLMIDIVAQTGRYPAGAGSLDNFVVNGEQRLWVHVAIDRLTGQIIDEQTEVVYE